MILKQLSDKSLNENLHNLVRRERQITLEVLHHLREVERRALYAKLAYSSLFEYAVKELKYSEGAAQRRISSMRLLKELPEIEKKVEAGSLTLSALAQAQTFFRQEKESIQKASDKLEVLKSLENKSLHEVQRELVSRSSAPEKLVPERLRPVTDRLTELKILVNDDFLTELESLRGVLAHKLPRASMQELLLYAVEHTLKKLRPELLDSQVNDEKDKVIVSKNSAATRYIPAAVKRAVWQRDQGQCTFSDPRTKRRCCSKLGLEYDHIHPFALGGTNSVENLRLRCRAHNQLFALQSFGADKMKRFVPSFR